MTAVKQPAVERTGDNADRLRHPVARQPAAAAPREAVWYLVDDAAAELKPGQARRAEYLRALERVVYRTAEHGLAPLGRTSRDCPYLRAVFRFYSHRDAAAVSSALRVYAPEIAWASSAAESRRMLALRVKESVRVWATTGRIARLPTWNNAESGVVAAQVRSGLGEPIPGAVRSRMEQAFGEDLSGVRLHTGAPAAEFAAEQKARALTIGQDIYFAHGQFRPGTLVGDAVLAHELAHVLQQRGGATPDDRIADRGRSPEYEQDADGAARAAVHSIWSKTLRATTRGMRRAHVAMRSGLSLQRCGPSATATQTPTATSSTLAFSSNNFKPSGGGPLTIADVQAATPSMGMECGTYVSQGDVTAAGGTDQEAADWQVGFLQTTTASKVSFDYQDQAKSHLFFFVVSLAGAARDGVPGTVEPWYDVKDSTANVPATNSTISSKMSDTPYRQTIWTLTAKSGNVAYLASSTGKTDFCAWLVARQISTGAITYLNWSTWEVDWGATFDAVGRTGSPAGSGSKLLNSNDGQGALTPVLTGPLAKDAEKRQMVP